MSELVAGHGKGSKILHDSGYVLPRLIGLLANEIEYYYARPTDSQQRSPSPSPAPAREEIRLRVVSR
jgi:hypothetical protein